MRGIVKSSTAGRLRVHLDVPSLSLQQADILEYYLRSIEGIKDVKVYDRTQDAVIFYSCDREAVFHALAVFQPDDARNEVYLPSHTTRELDREFEEKLFNHVFLHYFNRLCMPVSLRHVCTVIKALPLVYEGLKQLLQGHVNVSVLDGAASAVSIVRGDYTTASDVMFLLGIGDLLEEWTHKKSVDDLASAMSLNVTKTWVCRDGVEELVNLTEIKTGDEIIIRAGSMIPLDGRVCGGEAMVNQSSITGEPLPVRKTDGGYAYAGTVVEEGECRILVEKLSDDSRYSRIVKMIEESEKMKSEAEFKASQLADHLVPYVFLGSLAAYAFTRNVTRAVSVLMVDFSCALKLSMPLAVLAAMREANQYQIVVKGGKFLEAVSQADTIVFDKTGTITRAAPKVRTVIPFGNNDPDEMLRLAACLEEHYPHSIAAAVVACAKEKGLDHEEKHSQVEYVVAHGISSRLDDEKVIIGSYHFVFEDEKSSVPAGEEDRLNSLDSQYSHLYMAKGGALCAVIEIEDEIREEAADILRQLKSLGIQKLVMMTGDNRNTAKAAAQKLHFDEYHAEVLPEDKAAFIDAEHAAGRKVIMIGDGINDSPALSASDAGIAISSGAAIAREIADITISSDDLYALVTLKQLSDALMHRIQNNYKVIMTFNTSLIVLGALGILAPGTTALLHNSSTILISLHSMTRYMQS